MKNTLNNLVHQLNNKVKENVEHAFRAILKDMGLSSIN